MTALEAKEVKSAIDDILSIGNDLIITKSNESAQTLSQIILDATQYRVGGITGPFLQGNQKVWHIEK